MNLGTFSVRLLNCAHGSNESGHISCCATQLCMDPMNLCNFLLGYSTVHGPNESGHISWWATQLCSWTQWIWAYFLLGYSTVHGPNESGHISCWATQLCSWTQWIWAHFLGGYSGSCMDPMNLGTFPVMLLNCVHGSNESEHISCYANQLCAWTQWIWAHFLLGYSTVLMDPMNLGTFSVGLLK